MTIKLKHPVVDLAVVLNGKLKSSDQIDEAVVKVFSQSLLIHCIAYLKGLHTFVFLCFCQSFTWTGYLWSLK